VLTFDSTGELVSSEYRGDRAPYHYMASVSSLAFSEKGMVATCQESTNTYNGLMALPPSGSGPGNFFMGPTLFSSSGSKLVNSMGEGTWNNQSACDSATEQCFLLHEDMLHESPLCMGIAHDPESASLDGNIFWAFDGYNGQLLRYDFERPHGGGTGYLSADHSEATVRRYEDVQLHRQPGVSSHMVVDGAHRDLYIADSAGRQVLRVDVDSGRRDRDARTEYPIYSSTDIRFDYSIWSCTKQEVLLSVDSLVAAGLADDALDFLPRYQIVIPDPKLLPSP